MFGKDKKEEFHEKILYDYMRHNLIFLSIQKEF